MDQNTNTPNQQKQMQDNIRIEYEAICNKMIWLPNFRFTLIGLYVTAMGFIASRSPDWKIFALMLFITLVFWIIDLRTRWLLKIVGERGRQIEKRYWAYKWEPETADEPFLNHLESMSGKPIVVKFFSSEKRKFRYRFSHSYAFDLLFSGVGFYSAIRLIISLVCFFLNILNIPVAQKLFLFLCK